jgi:N-acetylglucosamine-6-sulfatase
MGYKAIRNQRWKYIRYVELNGMDELYDLDADPFEIRNLVNDPAARRQLDEMRRELDQLLDKTNRAG